MGSFSLERGIQYRLSDGSCGKYWGVFLTDEIRQAHLLGARMDGGHHHSRIGRHAENCTRILT